MPNLPAHDRCLVDHKFHQVGGRGTEQTATVDSGSRK
jgi:hypothetical protein